MRYTKDKFLKKTSNIQFHDVPSQKPWILLFCLTLFFAQLNGQTKFKYNFFEKPLIGQLQVMPPMPQPFQFETIGTNNFFPTAPNPNLPSSNSISEQNQKLIQQLNAGTSSQRVQQMAEIERDLMEVESYRKEMEWQTRSRNYHEAFAQLSALNPDSFSIASAVYIVENAYFDNRLIKDTFANSLKRYATIVSKLLKAEGIQHPDNIALNYGIQTLFGKTNQVVARVKNAPVFGYDFDDFRGEKDYTKMFVSKLLMTGKGQCHSLPLLYLLLAEQLGAKAQLSLAPQHSFIQFKDKSGRLVNFEPTNGHLVSNSWLTQSGYITSIALQTKTYISPLSHRQLYAQVLCDLMLGYLSKFPYDDFAEQIRKKALTINPNNLTALIVDANIKTQIAKQKVAIAGKPKEADLPKYPEAYQACQAMLLAYQKVEALGYQDMPDDAYQRWLQSIEQEKKKLILRSNVQTTAQSQKVKTASN